MLSPYDYGKKALYDEKTRALINKISFEHGGKEYDQKYPEGIPTKIDINTKNGKKLSSGLVMFPGGHARNESVILGDILQHKFKLLGKLALDKQELMKFIVHLENIAEMTNEDLHDIYDCNIKFAEEPIDGVKNDS